MLFAFNACGIDEGDLNNSSSSGDGLSDIFTDIRDNKVYKWVKIGNQTCMAQDLAYGNGYYDWSEAQTACPAGWHLPYDAEWKTLINYVGGNETKLKAAEGWRDNGNGTDDYGFSALPSFHCGGVPSLQPCDADGLWWTASWFHVVEPPYFAYARYISYYHYGVLSVIVSEPQEQKHSVRCVKDSQIIYDNDLNGW